MSTEPKIIDVVLPIVEVSGTPPTLVFERLLGTGFLVGASRYLLTCKHVVEELTPGRHALALKVEDQSFITIQPFDLRVHPKYDAALYRVSSGELVPSWLLPTAEPQHQTLDCHVWGYPADVLFDGPDTDGRGRKLQRPELVFTKGYIRRRISFPLPGLMGDQFYELNDSAGAGCSGGPVIHVDRSGRWKVFGIYAGEVNSEQSGKPVRSRGYALRMEAISDWIREIDPSIII